MSTPYSQSQPPAGLQALSLPVVDTDVFVVQRAGDNIVREVAASDVKSYMASGGGGGTCDEAIVPIVATWNSSTEGYEAIVDWAAGCAFNIQVNRDLSDHPGTGNALLLTHINLPTDAVTLSERTIIVSYTGNTSSIYMSNVSDANNAPSLSIGSTQSGLFGIGVITVLCPGNLTTPSPPTVATVAYTFAQSY